MPTVFRVEGFRYYFYSNEGSEPPHVHVVGKGGEMKVWLQPIAVESVYNLNPKDQKKILSTVRDRRIELERAWNEFASRKI